MTLVAEFQSTRQRIAPRIVCEHSFRFLLGYNSPSGCGGWRESSSVHLLLFERHHFRIPPPSSTNQPNCENNSNNVPHDDIYSIFSRYVKFRSEISLILCVYRVVCCGLWAGQWGIKAGNLKWLWENIFPKVILAGKFRKWRSLSFLEFTKTRQIEEKSKLTQTS